LHIALMEHPDFGRRDLSSLQAVCSGGTLVPAELVRRVESTLGVTLSIVFGTTECSPGLTQTWPAGSPEDKATTIGQPLPQTEVKIADLMSGEPMPVGSKGELCARGYLVMKGYYEMPEATAAATSLLHSKHRATGCSWMPCRSPIRARSRKLYYGIGSFAMNYRASLPIRMSEVCDGGVSTAPRKLLRSQR
jgi:acyl-CoA synthetase (AMP-forming)/AMP-acid ligase II